MVVVGVGRSERLCCNVWEDLHWADPTTLELLGLYIEQSPTVSMLNVLTLSTGVRATLDHALAHDAYYPQPPGTAPKWKALIGYQAAGKIVPSEVAEHIVAKSRLGCLCMWRKLTKTILESNYLQEESDRYTLAGPLSELTIPATLQDSLMGAVGPGGRR